MRVPIAAPTAAGDATRSPNARPRYCSPSVERGYFLEGIGHTREAAGEAGGLSYCVTASFPVNRWRWHTRERQRTDDSSPFKRRVEARGQ